MSTHHTALYEQQTNPRMGKPFSRIVSGKVRRASLVIASGTVLKTGDTIRLVRLKRGALVSPCHSMTHRGDPSVELDIGDRVSKTRYATALTGESAASFASFGGASFYEIEEGNEDIIATVRKGGTLGRDWELFVEYCDE